MSWTRPQTRLSTCIGIAPVNKTTTQHIWAKRLRPHICLLMASQVRKGGWWLSGAMTLNHFSCCGIPPRNKCIKDVSVEALCVLKMECIHI